MEVIVGKVEGINTSDGILNIAVVDSNKTTHNIKSSSDCRNLISQNLVYKFSVENMYGKLILSKVEPVESLEAEEIMTLMKEFGGSSPIDYKDSVNVIYDYIEKIENKIIKDITKTLVDRNYKLFFTYPAAVRMHHAYAGGLAHHTIGMLNMVDSFISNYPYLNKDYLYAGVILHDIGKVKEFKSIQDTEYSIAGQLIGHLVIGGLEIEKLSVELGYQDSEEVMVLEHILISHHGMPQFGAAKKPMTAEALVIWYIDTIDSKFRVLGEELEKTQEGTFSEGIAVLDRIKVYKPKK